MKNINKEVWRYLDNHTTIRKNLADEIINGRALAKKIEEDLHLNCSLNAIISAVRRYHLDMKEKDHLPEIYRLLTKARLLTRTKLASVLLKKDESVRSKLAQLYQRIDFHGGDTLRIFEVNKYIKIIVDERTLGDVEKLLDKQIVNIEKNLGEITITYNVDITKTPGVFALLSNELAANNISIIDSMICHSEHLVIVKEKDLQRSFNVLVELTSRKEP